VLMKLPGLFEALPVQKNKVGLSLHLSSARKMASH
jgi:hypothetical protein